MNTDSPYTSPQSATENGSARSLWTVIKFGLQIVLEFTVVLALQSVLLTLTGLPAEADDQPTQLALATLNLFLAALWVYLAHRPSQKSDSDETKASHFTQRMD